MLRAEQYHDSLDPAQAVPEDRVITAITGMPVVEPGDDILVAEAVLPDLRLLIDRLSYSVTMPYDPARDPPMLTARSLSQRMGVSTKTLTRWRALGLRWRWVVSAPDGRREVRYALAAVERFQALHGERVTRAAAFTQLAPAERRAVLEQARQLRDQGVTSAHQAAHAIAPRLGRAVETLRLIIEKHDQRHPDRAIFPDRRAPLEPQQKAAIAEAFAQGVKVGRLARLYKRGRSTIYRAIHETRAAAIRDHPLRYIRSPLFEREDADSVLLRPIEEPEATGRRNPVEDLPADLRRLYGRPILPPDAEHHLWVRMHYLRFKADQLRVRLDPYEPRVTDMDAFDLARAEADRVRNRLALANLPHVLARARHHLVDLPPAHRTMSRLLRLLELGNAELYEALEEHDPWGRQRTLERELNWRLMRRYASEPQEEASRALRRVEAEHAIDTLIAQAKAFGIDLLAA